MIAHFDFVPFEFAWIHVLTSVLSSIHEYLWFIESFISTLKVSMIIRSNGVEVLLYTLKYKSKLSVSITFDSAYSFHLEYVSYFKNIWVYCLIYSYTCIWVHEYMPVAVYMKHPIPTQIHTHTHLIFNKR